MFIAAMCSRKFCICTVNVVLSLSMLFSSIAMLRLDVVGAVFGRNAACLFCGDVCLMRSEEEDEAVKSSDGRKSLFESTVGFCDVAEGIS